jgi:hypothetical protein
LLKLRAGKIGQGGDKLVFSQGAEDEFQAGVITQDKFPDQPAGDDRVNPLVADRGEVRLADDNYRLGVAVPHAADFKDGTVEIMLFEFVLDCPQHFQSAGSAPAGGGTHHDDRLATLKPPPAYFRPALYLPESWRLLPG